VGQRLTKIAFVLRTQMVIYFALEYLAYALSMLQIFTQPAQDWPTVLFELIERHGSQGSARATSRQCPRRSSGGKPGAATCDHWRLGIFPGGHATARICIYPGRKTLYIYRVILAAEP
jgi:hypothetical protein